MIGNVAEWTVNEFEPVKTVFGTMDRVVRGGDWHEWPIRCCSDSRTLLNGSGQAYTGLRVILGRKATKR